MTGIDEYLAQVRGAMLGMDSRVRDDILRELRGHLTEATAANGGDAGQAIASFGPAPHVGHEYRRVYGYGRTFKALFVVAAAFLAFASSPFLGVGPNGALPNPLALLSLMALVAWLLGVSAVAGSRVGLYSGVAALAARLFVALALAAAYPGATVELLGGVTFALSNVLLVLVGWLPGTAKRAWSTPRAEL